MSAWVGGCCPHRRLDHHPAQEGGACTVPDCAGRICKGWRSGVKTQTHAPKPAAEKEPEGFTREEAARIRRKLREISASMATPRTIAARKDYDQRHPRRRGWGKDLR